MKRHKVIAHKNLPLQFPLDTGLCLYLMLDKFHAAGWLFGVLLTIYGLLAIGCLIGSLLEDRVELSLEELKKCQATGK